MDHLPISLNIKDRNCLVVGGGNIAIRKARQLLSAGAKLTAVSPEFHKDFLQQESEGRIKLIHSEYRAEHLQGMLLVVAATDDTKINRQVHHDAESAGILVNVVDQPDLCRFIVPSIVDRTPLTIAISTGGSGPVFARMLREKLEWLVPDNIGEFLTKVNQDRPVVADRFPEMAERRDFWEKFFERELGWNTVGNLSESNHSQLELDYQLFQSEQQTKQSEIALIDFGRSNIDDLSVSIINQLQKVDDLYITKADYDQLKDLIRRDADIHILDFSLSDYSDISCLLEDIIVKQGRAVKLSSTQSSSDKQLSTLPSSIQISRSVVVNDGHLFEQLDNNLSALMRDKKQIKYTRIAIAKYS